MNSLTRIYLLRHAEVETRYQRVFGGRIDMELSPRGHQQALALATYMRRFQLDAIEIDYASLTQADCSPHRSEIQVLNFTPWRDLA